MREQGKGYADYYGFALQQMSKQQAWMSNNPWLGSVGGTSASIGTSPYDYLTWAGGNHGGAYGAAGTPI